MAVGGSGTWNPSGNSSYNSNGTYTIPKGSNFKKYKVTQESYSGSFGTGKVIAPVEESIGNERFYVIALSDVTGLYSTWYWYYNANISDYTAYTSRAFGAGEQNTLKMITEWNSSGYNSQNERDMWGIDEVQSGTWNGSGGWYVPSRGEWAAFADQLGITSENYSSKVLSGYYWSSSQDRTGGVCGAHFDSGYVDSVHYRAIYYVRLSTTF